MESQIEISFFRQGNQVGSSRILNKIVAHPDFTDFFTWDDLVRAIKAAVRYFAGDEGGAASDAKDEIEDLLKRALGDNERNVYKNSEISFMKGAPMDEARVLFRAQSEDDLTKSKSFGKVDGPSGQIRDLG